MRRCIPSLAPARYNIRRMRVLHVTDTFLPKIGGAEIAIDQLVRAMIARGVDCSVLAQRNKGVRGHVDTPYPLRRFRGAQSARWAGWWFCRQIRKWEKAVEPFDVLIGHHAFPPGYACVKHSRRRGVPAIVYPRGGDIYEVSRYRKKPSAWRKLTWALANASAIVCASAIMEQTVRQIIGVSAAEGKTVRIPNGVNCEELRADAVQSRFVAEKTIHVPFVLALGRTIRRKGFHLLIEAFSRLPPNDWKLVIAGDGKDLDQLRAQAADLRGRVVFTGLVSGDDKRWLLQHCRFMAAPSLEESFGNVALEAMACGKPVIASRASGFSEIVRDRENGLLVDVGDVSSLADALRKYTAADLDNQSAAASRTAETFSWQTIAGRYVELIERVKNEW
jgi:glycosyltransferase involved in cell wall biosynthesis